ncbi:glutaredoxin family protein [Acidihalobacter ferrooxydans]|uniref:Thioredoxin family protein n=1 Tax=Acidihalobacter ferrooxydans TaxID=1765967 RepID=A0A1P8UHL1_9GAMM|nr:glutaredoxin family protein [Acidihalobacter ferrooxydans]APZ43319.1 thioredoxin family protein [Acidihalobacter ferrooxydans]
MTRLTLYQRTGCHLCEAMHARLVQLGVSLDFTLTCIDIESDPSLKRRFNEKIPVLAIGEDIICCHRLDERALRQALSDG